MTGACQRWTIRSPACCADGADRSQQNDRRVRRWSDPENRLWLAPAIALKVVLALYLSWNASRIAGGPYRIYQVATDTRSYLDPVENLFAKGIYIVDLDNPASDPAGVPA